MSARHSLYEQVIIDHNKNPRNYHALEDATTSADGHNPLCGDHVVVYLRMEGDTITDASFTGNGCAISKASASLMTSAIKGLSRKEADALFVHVHHMLTADAAPAEEQGAVEALRGVRDYPVRIKCATLPWHAFAAALAKDGATVRTE